MSFEAWMQRVDAILESRVGLSHLDLADICYRDMYDDGDTPSLAARAALENEGF